MDKLSVPSHELVSRISREVDFNDRLIGSNLHERAGVKTIPLYSLHELYMLLNRSYPQIDVHKMESWIRTVIKDEELAAQINMIREQSGSDLEKLLHMRDLIGFRLIQCRTEDS
jgi:hypothetical protein